MIIKRLCQSCLVVLSVSLCATILCPLTALGAEPTTAQEVLTQMGEARKAIRTASYEFRRQIQYVEPVRFEQFETHASADVGKIVVPAGTMAVHKQQFILDGQKYRYEDDGPIPYKISGPAEAGLGPHREILVFDGEKRILLDPAGPSANLDRGAGLEQWFCRPLMAFHFGLMVPGQLSGLGDLRLFEKSEWQGRSCYCLAEEVGPWRRTYWIDPERNWSLVREIRQVVAPEKQTVWSNKTMSWHGFSLSDSELEIAYEQDPSGLWRPAEWTLRQFQGYGADRKLEFVDMARVRKASLNQQIPPATFTVEVPDGARVFDGDRNVAYVWNHTMSIAQREAMVEAKARERADREEKQLQHTESNLKVGDIVPDFEFATQDGKTAKFADFHGKTILLCFWNQCVWGRRETVHLDATFKKFARDARFAMLCLHSADEKQRVLAREWIAENELVWPIYWVNSERLRKLESDFGVTSRGWVFLVGPDGKLLARNLSGDAIKTTVQNALQDVRR